MSEPLARSEPGRTAARGTLLGTACLAAGLIAAAVAVYIEAGHAFDPGIDVLGPAIIPQVLSTIIGALAIVLLLSSLAGLLRTRAPEGPQPQTRESAAEHPRLRWATLTAVAAATVLYVFALDHRWLGYFPLTTAYVAMLCLMLGPRNLHSVLSAVLLGAGLSAVTLYAFTRFFVTGLPQ